ncbi:MAG: hypothetical protein Q9180_006024 [Flavoplaca navasiana]
MLFPPQNLLVLVITYLTLGANALPISNPRLHANAATKNLVPRLEIQNEACKRAVFPRNDELTRRGCGGGGGDFGGWGDFGGGADFSGGDLDIPDSSTPIENIDIPTVEVHGHVDPPTVNIPTVEVHGQLPNNQPPNNPLPNPTPNGIDPQLIAIYDKRRS